MRAILRDVSTVASAVRPARGRWHLSLRLRLILLVLVGVLPLLGLSLVEAYLNYRAAVDRTGRETLARVRSLAEALDVELQARINVLEVLATSRRLRAGDLDGFRARVEDVMARQYPGANVVLLKEDGSQLMNIAAPPGASLPSRPHVATVRRVFATAKPAVSDLYLGAVLKRLVVSIDVPVLDADGRVLAVLSMVPAAGTFDDLIRRHGRDAGSVAAIFDARHVILARSHQSEQHIGQKAGALLLGHLERDAEGSLEAVSRDGVPVLAVFSRSRSFGWTVVVGVSRAEFTAPALASATHALAFAGMLLLAGLLLASFVSRRISGPIAALGSLASASERDVALPDSRTGLRETDQVADALRVAHDRRLRGERRFRTLFDANPLAMCVYDLDDLRLLQVNEAVTAQYGWSRSELLAMTVRDLYPPEQRDVPVERARERHRGVFNARQWRKDGSRFEIEAMVRIVELDGRRFGLATSHDITRRKAIEEQLRQAQKMDTLGQLAGGLAHDFNNSLAVVMGCLEEILEASAPDGETHAAADTAMRATQQAASLTTRLLTFSRRRELTAAELDIGAVIGDLHKILRPSVPPAIALTMRAEPGGARAVLDRTQLETAVMNLVVNARDAIEGAGATKGPDGGAIEVAVERRAISPDAAAASGALRAGDWVVVSVSDDGPGMTEAVQARIFEPFFTTKDVGKGTGLGLSQIHGFVSQSGGFITVDSTPGAGTRIALHFPAKA